METQDLSSSIPRHEPKILRRATIPLRDFEIDQVIDGLYLEYRSIGEFTNPTTGEIKEKFVRVFKEKHGDNKFMIWDTGGMKAAFQSSDIKIGDYIRIHRLQKKKMKGREGVVNQYDIFFLEGDTDNGHDENQNVLS